MSRPPWKLPVPDDDFIAALASHGYVAADYARAASVGLQTIRRRAGRLNIELVDPPAKHRPRFIDRVAALEDEIVRLTERIAALESRPAGGIIEWRPDHRRLSDGGTNVRRQRKAVGLPRRPSRRTA